MSGHHIEVAATDGGRFSAYIARPEKGSGPGVVLLQEIFGVTAFMRSMAERLAEEGYVAVVSSLGRAILAFSPDEVVDDVLAKGLVRRAPRTITSPAMVREQLERIRTERAAYEFEETRAGVCCIGAPILGRSGYAVAGLAIAGPCTGCNPKASPEPSRPPPSASAARCPPASPAPAPSDRRVQPSPGSRRPSSRPR